MKKILEYKIVEIIATLISMIMFYYMYKINIQLWLIFLMFILVVSLSYIIKVSIKSNFISRELHNISSEIQTDDYDQFYNFIKVIKYNRNNNKIMYVSEKLMWFINYAGIVSNYTFVVDENKRKFEYSFIKSEDLINNTKEFFDMND
jgi:ABC-type transport system involved in Fe-S cluster assembly fused permease/ATPase subunit